MKRLRSKIQEESWCFLCVDYGPDFSSQGLCLIINNGIFSFFVSLCVTLSFCVLHSHSINANNENEHDHVKPRLQWRMQQRKYWSRRMCKSQISRTNWIKKACKSFEIFVVRESPLLPFARQNLSLIDINFYLILNRYYLATT